MGETSSVEHVYMVTKYDPADFGDGGYRGPEDCDSDHGPVEGAYLATVDALSRTLEIEHFLVRDPEHFDGGRIRGRYRTPDPLAEVVPGGRSSLHDGFKVTPAQAQQIVRLMLRGENLWCRLEGVDAFVHIGFDQYMYLGSVRPLTEVTVEAGRLGLFPVQISASPYEPDDSEPIEGRSADESFFANLRQLVADRSAVMVEEDWVRNSTRWHRVTAENLPGLRPQFVPRARLTVWPDLSDTASVDLGAAITEDSFGDAIWQDHDGVVSWWDFFDAEELAAGDTELMVHLAGSARMWLRPGSPEWAFAGPFRSPDPLLIGVLPDADSVVTARWYV